jgi:hypothetical protein
MEKLTMRGTRLRQTTTSWAMLIRHCRRAVRRGTIQRLVRLFTASGSPWDARALP